MENNYRTVIFTSIAPIQSRLEFISSDLKKKGISLKLKKTLPYGVQLNVVNGTETGLINVYYSVKKGISVVDCSGNSISREVSHIISGTDVLKIPQENNTEERLLEKWIGTDESGKGDYFGPLVVAGFYIEKEREVELIEAGVKDSKLLSAQKIRSISDFLWNNFEDCIEITAPCNSEYNRIYDNYRNLNKLLAWAHGEVITNLVNGINGRSAKHVDGVVTDKFADESLLVKELSRIKKTSVIQRPRGESNPAVAAASIIARNKFELEIKKLEQKYATPLPLGAGSNVITAARCFVQKHGAETLGEVAKLHFKTTMEI